MLEGKVILVTGSKIGLAIGKEFTKQNGVIVIVCSQSEDRTSCQGGIVINISPIPAISGRLKELYIHGQSRSHGAD